MKLTAALAFMVAGLALSAPDARAIQDVQTFAPGLASASRLRFDSARNLFVTQRGGGGNRVAKIPVGSTTPVTFSSFPTSDVMGIAIDSHDNVFVADYAGGIVFKITPAGTRTVFKTGYTSPTALAVDAQDNIYVAELSTQDVARITPGGVETLYGNANLEPLGTARSHLTALGFDRAGILYCGSYGTGGSSVGPFALSTIPAGGGAGVRLPKVPLPIFDFALGPFDLFYTAGYQLDQLGQMSLAGAMSIYAGSGVAGLLNGTLPAARFNYPSGIAIDPLTGYIYIADWNNDVVRVIRDDVNGPTEARRSSWGRIKSLYR